MQLKYNQSKEIRMLNVFIPRDCGFFSMFNWYIGLLAARPNDCIYPFLNYDIQLQLNKTCNHFCYNNKKVQNSWMCFFKPVKFRETDRIHEQLNTTNVLQIVKQDAFTQGWDGDRSLMFFPLAEQLRKGPATEFALWRQRINGIFNKHIRLEDNLQNQIDEKIKMIETSLDTSLSNVIGVHFRNPSHIKEQGVVFLRDYFHIIDGLDMNKKIYLATDFDIAVAMFKHRYGSRVYVLPGVYRTSYDTFIEWIMELKSGEMDREGLIRGKGYDTHSQIAQSKDVEDKTGMKLGYDVITDVFILSKCKYLVNTVSNITTAVSYINPKTELHSVQMNEKDNKRVYS